MDYVNMTNREIEAYKSHMYLGKTLYAQAQVDFNNRYFDGAIAKLSAAREHFSAAEKCSIWDDNAFSEARKGLLACEAKIKELSAGSERK